MMHHTHTKIFSILLSVMVLGSVFPTSALAVSRTTPFQVGETTDPGTAAQPCGPTDTNCFPSVNALGPVGTTTGQGGIMKFLELLANGTNYIGFRAPDSIASSTIWTLPASDGGANSALTTDGSGNLSWVVPGANGVTTAGYFNATSSAGYKLGGTTLLTASSTGYNTFVGLGAGTSTTSGFQNTFIGYQVGQAGTSAVTNTGTGYQALFSNKTGNANSAYGVLSLASNTTGFQNTAAGISSLRLNTTGSYNTANGALSLYNTITGNYNTALGYYAGEYNTGSNNTFIGANAGYTDGTVSTPAALTNATAIGYNAQVTASNSLILGGTGAYGVNVGIGTTSPYAKLSVAGSVVADSFNATSTTATSTFANNISIANGASYRVGGTPVLTADTSANNLNVGTSNSFTAGGASTAVGSSNTVGGIANNTAIGLLNNISAPFNGVTVGNGNSSTANGAIAIGNSVANTTSGSLMIGPSDAAKLTILSTGNVGIGTTTPSSKLTFQGTVGQTTNFLTVASSTGTSVFNVDSSGRLAITRGTGLSGFNQSGGLAVTGTYSTGNYGGDPALPLGNMLSSINAAPTSADADYYAGTLGRGIYSGSASSTGGVMGSFNEGRNSGALGTTLANVYGSYNYVNGNTSIAATTNAYGSYNVVSSISTPTTNAYGVFAQLNGASTNAYGVYINNQSGATNNYALYTANGIKSYFGGNVGIGTTSPYATLSVAGNVVADSFNATSTTATSTFTAGVNVGVGNGYFINGAQAVSGLNNGATSFGFSNTISGSSLAFGNSNTSTGIYSIAAGLSNISNAGLGSSAFGYSNTASGVSATALGYFNTSSGGNSVAVGSSNTSSGSNSVAMGYNNNATTTGSVAFGRTNNSGGSNSIALGILNNVYASQAMAVGRSITNNTASSLMIGPSDTAKVTILGSTGVEGYVGIGTTSPYAMLSVAGGVVADSFNATSTTATSTFASNISIAGSASYRIGGVPVLSYNGGTSALSLGNANTNTGSGSTIGNANISNNAFANAFGANNTSSGIFSNAFGYSNNATNTVAVALGAGNNAGGVYSVALGYSNSAYAANSSAIGANVINTVANSLQIGPSDASKLTILTSGNVGVGTTTPNGRLNTYTTLNTADQIGGVSVDLKGATLPGGNIYGNKLSYFGSLGGVPPATNIYLNYTAESGSCIGCGASKFYGSYTDFSGSTANGTKYGYYANNYGGAYTLNHFFANLADGSLDSGYIASSTSAFTGTFLNFTKGNAPILMVSGGTGNVGVGTTTPYSKLSVNTGDIGAFNGAICADNGGTVKCYGALTAGIVYGDGSSFVASDVAENYPSADTSIGAGDVVMLASQLSDEEKAKREHDKTTLDTLYKGETPNSIRESLDVSITKASQDGKGAVLGIVSTKPGVLLGDTTGLSLETTFKPVALSGRVPLKVSGENGTITKGDRITLSSTPGVGAKATATSSIIVATALEDFTATDTTATGTILAFVDLEHDDAGLKLEHLVSLGGSTSTTTDDTFVTRFFDRMRTWLADTTNGIAEIAANIFRGKEFHAEDKLCIGQEGNETCVTKTQLDQLLQNQVASPALSTGSQTSAPSPAPASTDTSTTTSSLTATSTSSETGTSTSEVTVASSTPVVDSNPTPVITTNDSTTTSSTASTTSSGV